MRTIKPILEEDQNASIADNAARAPFFAIFDDDQFVKFVKNPFVSWWWAGFAVADLLKEEWCEKFIAKKIWDNMKNKLDEYGIVYEIVS